LIIDLAEMLLLPVLKKEVQPEGEKKSPNVISNINSAKMITKTQNSLFIIYFSDI
jgi:hypothetical protein